ncbi:Epoxyqueuosine reductase [hydrothermal vent metagenome]|uniref:Epoxyqueuosine reductase n=1 Tax=hydrothermal vent metagenome TaxID=652676 RepID=A0A3B1DQF1_9ZZZZ
MPYNSLTSEEQIKSTATSLGFELVGIASAVSPVGFSDLQEWLKNGFAGEMHYMERRENAYQHPKYVLPEVKSVIMLGLNYQTKTPAAIQPGEGRVARYAWGTADYHDLLRDKLKTLGNALHEIFPECHTRGVVDTAPLLERDFARLAGLGWFGKNTMLINKQKGSWFFLAALLTDISLQPDQPHNTSHCGTCTRCLDICPTDAFAQPYVLDASKCISYLTIEHRGNISEELCSNMGEWLFGCDLCQEVCPWNRKAPVSKESVFQPEPELNPVDAVALLQLTEETFRERFRNSPLSRSKRAGLLRNAAILLGNSGNQQFVPVLIAVIDDDEPVIRAAVIWALKQLGGKDAIAAIKVISYQ